MSQRKRQRRTIVPTGGFAATELIRWAPQTSSIRQVIQMQASTRLASAPLVKRSICALLAIGGFTTIAVDIVTRLHTGQFPSMDEAISGLATLAGASVFGLYAIKGSNDADAGVMSEPSDEVQLLANRPGSKIEAIKAYREQTGLDLKRAKEVVERLASQRA